MLSSQTPDAVLGDKEMNEPVQLFFGYSNTLKFAKNTWFQFKGADDKDFKIHLRYTMPKGNTKPSIIMRVWYVADTATSKTLDLSTIFGDTYANAKLSFTEVGLSENQTMDEIVKNRRNWAGTAEEAEMKEVRFLDERLTATQYTFTPFELKAFNVTMSAA
jgi:hypothetical protein